MAGGLTGTDPALASYLNRLVERYEVKGFITRDPVSVPHAFDDPRDQEVIGLYAALLAWGRRDTLLRNLESLCERMDLRPHRFVARFDLERDGDRLEGFRHRTFQPADALWLTRLLSLSLKKYGSIERAFSEHLPPEATHVGPAIDGFVDELLSMDPRAPARLRKHLARPSAGSACKRIAMYLRWMVRGGPVDLGIWTTVSSAQLVLPLDVHSRRMIDRCGLCNRKLNDWRAVLEVTEACRRMCPDDPARYDFAFFGPGATGEEPGDPP